MRIAVVGLALATALATSGCRERPVDPERIDVSDVSIVFIVLDAAGARHLSAYGNPLPTSPNLESLARGGGTAFMRAYSQSAWTLPSTASFLTGRYPRRRKQAQTVVEGETLASILQKAGFVTAAFSENPFVTSTFGFDRGFDTFHEYFPKALLDADPSRYTTDSARPTTDAIAWLEAHPDQRTFLYLHILTPHSPYQPPLPFLGRFDPAYEGTIDAMTETLLRMNEGLLAATGRDIEHLRLRYQENLAYGDHQVGRIVDALRRTGQLDRTIVVVTADHGEAFREHGVLLHTTTLFEEMIHVPLVIRLPARYGPVPGRFDGIVELRDLVPTLCHALHAPCPGGTARSLLRRLRARTPAPRVARAWTTDGSTIALGAIVTPDRKLVLDAKARSLALYNLASDPAEHHDLAPADPARARRLARRLRSPRPPHASPRPAGVAEGTARKLRALGYSE